MDHYNFFFVIVVFSLLYSSFHSISSFKLKTFSHSIACFTILVLLNFDQVHKTCMSCAILLVY